MIVLQKGFYKESGINKTGNKKQLIVSIEKTVAELHGLYQNMVVTVRRISPEEFKILDKNVNKGYQLGSN